MLSYLKKYWLFVLLGFVVTTLVVLKVFLPKVVNTTQTTPLPKTESFKGIVPGVTTPEDLNKILGQPDSTLSNLSENTLAYPREGGGPSHLARVGNDNKVEFFKQQALEGNLSTYVEKYGKHEGEYYGDLQESGLKVYVWATKGIAVLASVNNGYLFEVWYFKPISLTEFLSRWGTSLTAEPKTQGY